MPLTALERAEEAAPPAHPETGFDDPQAFANLRFELADHWKVQELALFLTRLRTAYACLDLFVSATLDPKAMWKVVSLKNNQQAVKDFVLKRITPVQELPLASIRMQSPGWAEVVGKLNPFKFILDVVKLIRDWRTTIKGKDLENEQRRIKNEQEREALERLRLKNEQLRQHLAREIQREEQALMTEALKNQEQALLNEAQRLKNESQRLENESRAFANGRQLIEARKEQFEADILRLKVVQEALTTLEQANVSQTDRKALAKALVVEPLKEFSEFVVTGKVRAAEVRLGGAA